MSAANVSNTCSARTRSRSPRRGLFSFFGGVVSKAKKLVEKPEDKMHKWAQKSGQADATRVKELMDTMQIADFEKAKMVAVFKCPRSEVAAKLSTEFKAKQFPTEVIESVVEGLNDLTFYDKSDSHFEHTSKASEKGKSNLYQYAVWCKVDSHNLMDVSIWAITTNFKKGSTGAATKNEIEGLKNFMEQETRSDVLKIADGPKGVTDATGLKTPTPEMYMVAYAKTMHSARPTDMMTHEDELIKQMEIVGFSKYKTNLSFKCPKGNVIAKVAHEMNSKHFPDSVVHAVTQGLEDMSFYKKMDEDFKVCAHDGRSNYYKYAFWCSADEHDEIEVSMICIAASFKKKSNGPATKSEIELWGHYLGQEACADVLKVHAPDALE